VAILVIPSARRGAVVRLPVSLKRFEARNFADDRRHGKGVARDNHTIEKAAYSMQAPRPRASARSRMDRKGPRKRADKRKDAGRSGGQRNRTPCIGRDFAAKTTPRPLTGRIDTKVSRETPP
jgi:hypothetical protein